jgi:hypothetical protein
MMSLLDAPRLGIIVGRSDVHSVLLHSGVVRWTGRSVVREPGPIAAIQGLLAEVPRTLRRPRAIIALGEDRAQLRRLRELPRTRSERMIRAGIAEGAARFFLKNGAPLVTTGVAWTGEREGWSAAFERPLAEALAAACAASRVYLDAIVPLAAFDGATPASIANVTPRHPLAYLPASARSQLPKTLVMSVFALVIALVFVALAPALASIAVARHARQELRTLGYDTVAARRMDHERSTLLEQSRELRDLFQYSGSYAILLGQLADALPDDSFLTSLRVDSLGGIAVLIAERAADAVDAFSLVPGVEGAEILGAITRDRLSEEIRERVTVQFQWKRRRS